MANPTREELISELTNIYKAQIVLDAGRTTRDEIKKKGVVTRDENGVETGTLSTQYYQDKFSDRYYNGLNSSDYKVKSSLIEEQPNEKLQLMLKAERDALAEEFRKDNIPIERMDDIVAYEQTRILIAFKKASLAQTQIYYDRGELGIDEKSMAELRKNNEATIRALEEQLTPQKLPIELDGTIEFDTPDSAPKAPGKKMFRPVPPNELPSAARQRGPSRVPNAIEPKSPAQRGTEPPDLDHEDPDVPQRPDSKSGGDEFKEPAPSFKRQQQLDKEQKEKQELENMPEFMRPYKKLLKEKFRWPMHEKGLQKSTNPKIAYDGEAPTAAPSDPTLIAAMDSYSANKEKPMASDFNLQQGTAQKKGGKSFEI